MLACSAVDEYCILCTPVVGIFPKLHTSLTSHPTPPPPSRSRTDSFFFRFGKRFEPLLIYQSIAAICTQFLMLHISTKVRVESTRKKYTDLRSFFDLEWEDFWNWDDFSSFGMCFVPPIIFFPFVCVVLSVFIYFYFLLLWSASLSRGCLLHLILLVHTFPQSSSTFPNSRCFSSLHPLRRVRVYLVYIRPSIH